MTSSRNSDMIFRLARRNPRGLDPEPPRRSSRTPRQRTLVKKAGQIVGGIGKQLAAAEAR